MNHPSTSEHTLQHRFAINRRRALIIAEYLCFSRTLLSDQQDYIVSEEEWRDLIRHIEFHINLNEEGRVVIPTSERYEPLRLFFTNTDPPITIVHFRNQSPRVGQVWVPPPSKY